MKRYLFIITAALLPIHYANAATLYVPSQYPTIQAGINSAVNGDTVLIADGTYTGSGNINLDFGGRAIVVMSENGPENCIIDCQRSGRGFYFHSGETASSIVKGLTIINGYVDSQPIPYYKGGGIYCGDSSPTISRCHILNCRAAGG